MATRRLTLSLTISLAALFGSTAAAQAAGCDTWHGPGGNSSEATSGEWGVSTNWSAGLPTPQTPVCITVPGTYTVTLIPYADTHYAGDDGGAAESLTIGASSGTQNLQVLGEAHGFEGDWYNVTSLAVADGVTIGPHGVLALEAPNRTFPTRPQVDLPVAPFCLKRTRADSRDIRSSSKGRSSREPAAPNMATKSIRMR